MSPCSAYSNLTLPDISFNHLCSTAEAEYGHKPVDAKQQCSSPLSHTSISTPLNAVFNILVTGPFSSDRQLVFLIHIDTRLTYLTCRKIRRTPHFERCFQLTPVSLISSNDVHFVRSDYQRCYSCISPAKIIPTALPFHRSRSYQLQSSLTD